jgi:hypothetical protein
MLLEKAFGAQGPKVTGRPRNTVGRTSRERSYVCNLLNFLPFGKSSSTSKYPRRISKRVTHPQSMDCQLDFGQRFALL